ncbi:hypothetical protein NMS_1631 [Nonlabens marinus S1-08]|uniref:Uncharacterized protein n=1 Tax=Nonlabens marinus S1-08 TaxID=1454201 RepID=W8VRG7_9FLAO|nr:hypothetical protein NMS_1631 [Nonlabens marinus S1-08]
MSVENALVHSIPTDSKIIVALSDMDDLQLLLNDNPLMEQLQSLSRMEELKKASAFLDNYSLKEESFIALSIEGKNQVAITLVTEGFKNPIDSASIKKRIEYNQIEILEKSAKGGSYYSANKDGVHIASSSLLVVESLIRRNIAEYVFDPGFQKLYERTHDDLSFYVRATDQNWLYYFLLGRNKSELHNYAQWFQLSLKKDPTALHFEGLISYKDSIKQKHALYNNLEAQENQLDRIAPANSRSLSAFTYGDVSQLTNNLTTYYNRMPTVSPQLMDILSNAQEVSQIQLEQGSALAFTLLPYETLFMDLDSLSSAKSTYRDQSIYSLTKPITTNSLSPLLTEGSFSQVALLDDFLVIAADRESIEMIVSNYENGTTLAAQLWWKDAKKNISNSSSLINITSVPSLKSPIIEVSKEDLKVLNAIDMSTTKAIISQYVHEDGYAFYRMEIPYATTAADQPLVAQIGTFKSEKNIIAGPHLFPNHLNNTQDVAFQSEDFQLTLISENGTPYWSKSLDSKIVGDIHAVDVYKNGRKQLLFSTEKKVYLLDRDGENVDQFPYDAKKTITQPLSVFDYDNDKDYRFVVTTGDEITLLNNRGNTVSGFNYKKSGKITSSPQHFKRGNKDYIAFTTARNQLQLLSRTGQVRTRIKDKIEARSPLYFNNNLIQFINSQNKLLQVNPTTGKVTTAKTSLDPESHIYMTERSQLIQTKNTIQFNGNKADLPYGTYLPAEITKVGSQEFVSVVDNGENKVYIIDSKGSILPFLPVYGNGTAEIAGGKERYLTTRDGNDVIIYKW